MDRLPLFLDVRNQQVVIVGGGAIAARKYRLLASAGAAVKLVAPRLLDASLQMLLDQGRLLHLASEFLPQHLDGARLVVAATGVRDVNGAVAAAARSRGIWVNVVDDGELSDAIIPSIVDRSPVIVAISTGGASPVLARRLRARLEAALEPSLGALAQLLASWRARFLARWPEAGSRRLAMDRLLDGELPDLIAQGRLDRAESFLKLAVTDESSAGFAAAGHVTLVGAGPGDPGLLTLKALQALQRADVILHDRLVAPAILSMARRDADLVDVGKTGGGPSTSQEHIHALLLAHAKAGKCVVRLKGGDPFVFGRGSEERDVLLRAGVAVDVVPGVTAALALSLAGIPLTLRGSVAGVRLLTAQRAADAPEPDWQSWAESQDTLVIYMAAAALPSISERLLQCGMSASTPAALVEGLSLPTQRVVIGNLLTLPELANTQRIGSPSILVIGAVVLQANDPLARVRDQAA